ncbi:MAG: GrdX family protein [Bacillota bacterium]
MNALKKILITNNPMVNETFSGKMGIIYRQEFSYVNVLSEARDRIHHGYKLLTHPLSGSVKPNETPYKSVVIQRGSTELDMESLMMIEGSIDTAKKFIASRKTPIWTEKIRNDFQLIDFYLIKGAIDSMEQF